MYKLFVVVVRDKFSMDGVAAAVSTQVIDFEVQKDADLAFERLSNFAVPGGAVCRATKLY